MSGTRSDPQPESVGRLARKVAGGTVRVVLGAPLLVVSAAATGAMEVVNDLARWIEGKPGSPR